MRVSLHNGVPELDGEEKVRRDPFHHLGKTMAAMLHSSSQHLDTHDDYLLPDTILYRACVFMLQFVSRDLTAQKFYSIGEEFGLFDSFRELSFACIREVRREK